MVSQKSFEIGLDCGDISQIKFYTLKASYWAGTLVKWLWEMMIHVREVVGSNTGAVYWMDMTFFHIDLL